ncbi:MAG TPA: MarR family transcriptional regulator [Terriglobales bacterium]|nr:MarR family transcriptional regulator [Terriglobales bacterium]
MARAQKRAPAGLWYSNWRIWLAARKLLEEALAPVHLHPKQFWLLALIRESPKSQTELASLCGVDPSTLVALLDELQACSWITRIRHPMDRRVHLVALTEAGSAILGRAMPLARRAETRQLRALAGGERTRLLALLRKLVDAKLES